MTWLAVIFVLCLAVMFWAHLLSIREERRIQWDSLRSKELNQRVIEARKRIQLQSWQQGAVPTPRPLPMVPDYPKLESVKTTRVGPGTKKPRKKPKKTRRG